MSFDKSCFEFHEIHLIFEFGLDINIIALDDFPLLSSRHRTVSFLQMGDSP